MDHEEMERRLVAVENTQERHSERLTNVERKLLNDWNNLNTINRDMEEMKKAMKTNVKKMKRIEIMQRLGEQRSIKYQKWTIALLIFIIALFGYIAFKSPETARDVATIAATTATKAI